MYPQWLRPIPGAIRATREDQHNVKGARGGQRIVSGQNSLENRIVATGWHIDIATSLWPNGELGYAG